jgi:DUF971 family protein
MTEPAHTPIELRAPRGGRIVEIDFEDGHTAKLPNEQLRGYCPCATCQGHGGDINFVEGANAELGEIEQVGNYALRLTWGDGHDTGIYTFRYLRALCCCEQCLKDEDPKARQLSR